MELLLQLCYNCSLSVSTFYHFQSNALSVATTTTSASTFGNNFWILAIITNPEDNINLLLLIIPPSTVHSTVSNYQYWLLFFLIVLSFHLLPRLLLALLLLQILLLFPLVERLLPRPQPNHIHHIVGRCWGNLFFSILSMLLFIKARRCILFQKESISKFLINRSFGNISLHNKITADVY